MSTITIVRRAGEIAIAADTLTKWGTIKESAHYVANSGKIIRVGESYLGFTGYAAVSQSIEQYLNDLPKPPAFDGVASIYKTFQDLHKALKDDHFLKADSDSDDVTERSHVNVLIANRYGIFGVSSQRFVQEFTRYYVGGSGRELALGAMYALYNLPYIGTEEIARAGVMAAAEFDDCTGLPLTSFAMTLDPSRFTDSDGLVPPPAFSVILPPPPPPPKSRRRR